MTSTNSVVEETVGIFAGSCTIYGTLVVPENAWGAVIITQGCGCSRRSLRNLNVSETFHDLGMATLSVDLLTPSEEQFDAFTARYRFNIVLLTERLVTATQWLRTNCSQYDSGVGYFASHTGAAAALNAASECEDVAAVVSKGGRLELPTDTLSNITAATLLIVGGLDGSLIDMNRSVYERLENARQRELKVIPNATHLFEERGARQSVAQLSGQWFMRYLGAASHSRNERPINRRIH